MRWRSPVLFGAAALLAAACARHPRITPIPPPVTPDTIVRVAIAAASSESMVSATSLLAIVDGRTGIVLATARQGESWRVRPLESEAVSFTRDGAREIVVRGSAILRVGARDGFVIHNGRRYRGTMRIARDGAALQVLNNVGIEDYLKGVVPLEIGHRRADEAAAIAAQSIAARSYTYARLAVHRRDESRSHDMVPDETDQMYGGLDAELPDVSRQIDATRGLVLKYAGRVIEAVYSAACGGRTTDVSEIWSGIAQPYLPSVSDRIPGRDGYYCDIAPRFNWSATFDRSALVAAIDSYVRGGASAGVAVSKVASVSVGARTNSGRVKSVALSTNAGRFEVVGENIRHALRQPNGEILRSTNFELSAEADSGAGVLRLELRGTGHGHGVGMCQWGAIGRARSGQSYRDILSTYYPGARVESIR